MLVLRELRKRYGDRIAVDGVSLELVAGEVFGLLGPNGAGKSTLVSLAVGLLAADGGSAELAGVGAPNTPSVRRKIGVAPQQLAVYARLTGDENLRFFAQLYGLSGSALEDRVRWALEFVGLEDRRHDRVSTYSGGMARRLNLAAAVVHDPELLLLDEPTVGVDPQSRNRLLENIESLRELGKTVLYTTHYMEEAQRLCDRVAILDAGRVLAIGTVDELLLEHGSPPALELLGDGETKIIETDDPAGEIAALVEAGRSPERFRVRRPDLEQVFLQLTGRSLRD